jgi:WbqC-like protein
MKVVILQPSYIPWRGYFHQILKADLFILYDDVQYDKHGWRNRNRIKTAAGSRWLTIPVFSGGAVTNQLLIKDTKIDWNKNWNISHFDVLRQNYKSAPYYNNYSSLLQEFYQRKDIFLADFTIDFTIALARELGIGTTFMRSSSLNVTGTRTDRLVEILTQVGATNYISGPSAKDYLEEEKLLSAGISLEYMAYDYPEYPQLYPPFDAQVTVLDLMFMVGPEALHYI